MQTTAQTHLREYKRSKFNNWLHHNREIHPSQILDVRTLTSANVKTQHGLILHKYRFKAKLLKRKPPLNITKFNIESLQDDSTKRLYRNKLERKIASNLITEEDNIEKTWKKIKENISGKWSTWNQKSKYQREKNKPWFTDNIRALVKEKKEAYLTEIQEQQKNITNIK